MMLMAFTLKNDYMDELERRLRMLQQETVEVGMFDNTKREDSDWTNVSLFAYLSAGDPDKNLIGRPALELAFAFNPISKSPMKKELKVYFSDIKRKKGKSDVMKVLHSVGKFYRDETVKLFGNSSVLEPNTDFTVSWKESMGKIPGQDPLIMTSSMRNSIAYKIENNVWEYGG